VKKIKISPYALGWSVQVVNGNLIDNTKLCSRSQIISFTYEETK